MKLAIFLALSSFFGAGVAGAFVVAGEPGSTSTTTSATLTIPGANSLYTGTLTVRELEMFTVTNEPTTTIELTQEPVATVTDIARETVTVVGPQGPRGPRGFRGPAGPPGGLECPPGFTAQARTINTPGGQEQLFACWS